MSRTYQARIFEFILFMFVCIFCNYFIEIGFLLTGMTNYMTISSSGCGAKQRLHMKLCTVHVASLKWTLNPLIKLGGCLSVYSLCAQEILLATRRVICCSCPNKKYNISNCYSFSLSCSNTSSITQKRHFVPNSMHTFFG